MIDRRVLVLRTVAARGTITSAAEALGYTPSAVSHQLRTLARDLGVDLLEPEGRGVRLTAAARILLEGAEDLNARWEELRADLASAAPRGGETLTLCAFSTGAVALLPAAAAKIRRSDPQTSVRIIEATPEECFDLLLTEHADLGVVVATSSTPAMNDPRFEQRTLLDDPLELLVPADHPLARRSSVCLSEAAEDQWILGKVGDPCRDLVQSDCLHAGFTPFVAHEVSSWETAAALVGAGLGVALIPRLTRLAADRRCRRIPLSGQPVPARHILTAVRRGRGEQPAIASALSTLRAIARLKSTAAGRNSGSVIEHPASVHGYFRAS